MPNKKVTKNEKSLKKTSKNSEIKKSEKKISENKKTVKKNSLKGVRSIKKNAKNTKKKSSKKAKDLSSTDEMRDFIEKSVSASEKEFLENNKPPQMLTPNHANNFMNQQQMNQQRSELDY